MMFATKWFNYYHTHTHHTWIPVCSFELKMVSHAWRKGLGGRILFRPLFSARWNGIAWNENALLVLHHEYSVFACWIGLYGLSHICARLRPSTSSMCVCVCVNLLWNSMWPSFRICKWIASTKMHRKLHSMWRWQLTTWSIRKSLRLGMYRCFHLCTNWIGYSFYRTSHTLTSTCCQMMITKPESHLIVI